MPALVTNAGNVSGPDRNLNLMSAAEKASQYGKYIFNAQRFVDSIKHELLGEPGVIVNITNIGDKELHLLYQEISKRLLNNELNRIVVVHADLPTRSMNNKQFLTFLKGKCGC